jgi:hypothetical protein
MAALSYKIQAYLNREVDFTKDVILQNDGDGVVYIHQWNVAEAQPTEEQLNALEAEATTLGSNDTVDFHRKQAYGDWREQLDEIYHNIDAWKTRIKSIKDAKPKS